MSANDEKSVQLFLKSQMWISCQKSYYFFEQRAFKRIFVFVLMQMCASLKDHMRVDYVFSALCMVCPGSAVSGIVKATTGKACNECKTFWSVRTGLC